jgi:hypothetical protein
MDIDTVGAGLEEALGEVRGRRDVPEVGSKGGATDQFGCVVHSSPFSNGEPDLSTARVAIVASNCKFKY